MISPNLYPTSNDHAQMAHAAWGAADPCDWEDEERWERDHEVRDDAAEAEEVGQ